MGKNDNDNVKELQALLENIQKETGLNMGEISIQVGYKNSNYLSEQISKKDVSDSLLKKVKIFSEQGGTFFRDAAGVLIENNAELIATNRVILSILAEIQASQGKGFATDLSNTYRRMVKDELIQVRSEQMPK